MYPNMIGDFTMNSKTAKLAAAVAAYNAQNDRQRGDKVWNETEGRFVSSSK